MIISIISTFKHALNKHLKINIQAGKKKKTLLKTKVEIHPVQFQQFRR